MARPTLWSRKLPSVGGRRVSATLLALLLPVVVASAEDEKRGEQLTVVGPEFRLQIADGRVLRSADLTGAVLGIVEDGTLRRVRIDSVEPDPLDTQGEVLLHSLSVFDESTSQWVPYCLPDGSSKPLGFPYVIDSRSGRFALTCTGGAEAKCVRMGYRPWKTAPNGRPLRDYFLACIHLVRADYCGDDRPATRDGTMIDVYDRIGIQEPTDDPSFRFEAGWGKGGAVCVARTRIPALLSADDLYRQCARLAEAPSGPDCTEARLESDDRVLLFNRSRLIAH